ncbi:hypothetical protein L210DRAFT_3644264 [Boletus edulis BED1]|uniref:Uncharacterized protein n=1 Tax=Boletus edulis BED1 TaxID=1328754 RepID=A0AAD4BWQ0_BOLED|nr:hypothetical protein L210DRAFT_3644264 [Boletus edulis BED1]
MLTQDTQAYLINRGQELFVALVLVQEEIITVFISVVSDDEDDMVIERYGDDVEAIGSEVITKAVIEESGKGDSLEGHKAEVNDQDQNPPPYGLPLSAQRVLIYWNPNDNIQEEWEVPQNDPWGQNKDRDWDAETETGLTMPINNEVWEVDFQQLDPSPMLTYNRTLHRCGANEFTEFFPNSQPHSNPLPVNMGFTLPQFLGIEQNMPESPITQASDPESDEGFQDVETI